MTLNMDIQTDFYCHTATAKENTQKSLAELKKEKQCHQKKNSGSILKTLPIFFICLFIDSFLKKLFFL